MATYHYISPNGLKYKDVNLESVPGFEFYIDDVDDVENSSVIFVVKHGINENPEILCPFTKKPASKTLRGCTPEFYEKGMGLARDKEGARRDMNIHTLQNNDPYGYMRSAGEKDDMINRLKKGGKYNGNTKYFTT